MIFTVLFLVFGLDWFASGVVFEPKCCSSVFDPKVLMTCLKENPSNFTLFPEGSAPTAFIGPTLRIGIIFYATTDIDMYSSYSLAITRAYADYHNYELIVHDEFSVKNGDGDDYRWNKVNLLFDSINPYADEERYSNSSGVGRDWDYVVWMDADLILLDFYKKIEMIIYDADSSTSITSPHMWVSAEHAGSSTRINSGMLIFRNSMWSFHFLKAWWIFGNRLLYSDQEQFDLLYTSLARGYNVYNESKAQSPHASKLERKRRSDLDMLERDRLMHYLFHYGSKSHKQANKSKKLGPSLKSAVRFISILPPNILNSDPPAMVNQQASDGVLHLMGESVAYRRRVFAHGFNQICYSMELKQKGEKSELVAAHSDVGCLTEKEDTSTSFSINTCSAPDINTIPIVPQQLGLSQWNLLVWAIQSYYLESSAMLKKYRHSIAESRIVSISNSRRLSNAIHHFAYAVEHVNTLIWERQGLQLNENSQLDPGEEATLDVRLYPKHRQSQRWRTRSGTELKIEAIPYEHNSADAKNSVNSVKCDNVEISDSDWNNLHWINNYFESGVASMNFEKMMFKWLNIGLNMRVEVYALFKHNLQLLESSLEQQTGDAIRRQQQRIKLNAELRTIEDGMAGPIHTLTPLQLRCNATTSDDLEMYKATAEAGQNLLHVKYYGSSRVTLRDKLQIADEIYQFLEGNVKQCCHRQQYQAVDVMLSQLHLDMGLALYHNDYVETDISVYVRRRHRLYYTMCANESGTHTEGDRMFDSVGRRDHNIRLSVRHFDESIRILEEKSGSAFDSESNGMSIVERTGVHGLIHPYTSLIHALDALGMKERSMQMKMKLHAVKQMLMQG